jgi:bifunctional lysine-specific demethylase and histidyl-hydroxylase NO66
LIGRPQRGPVGRPALSRLISESTQAFANEYWGRQPLLTTHAERAEDFSDLFSLNAVDELVAERAVRTPFVRMAREGDVLAASRYTAGGGYGAEISDQLDSEKVLSEFSDGSTLVLQGLHRIWPALADFIRQLDADLGCPCQANAYITPASARGFDPHYDVHDVFVIQIHGEKAWTIHEPVHVDPLGTQPWSDHRAAVADKATQVPYLQHTFVPGDVLYLPRGWIHSATALGGTSVHVTIGISSRTRYDIVQRLLGELAGNPRLRASLPLGWAWAQGDRLGGHRPNGDRPETDAVREADAVAGTDALAETDAVREADAAREAVRQTLVELREALASPALIEGAATRVADALRGSMRAAPVRPLATVDALDALDANTVVGWRSGLPARITVDGTAVTIALAAKSVSLPIETAAALTALHHGDTLPAGRLPGLDAESSLVVARRLIREAILVVA